MQAVDAAELELLRNGSGDTLIAALPAAMDRVRTELPDTDDRRQGLESFIADGGGRHAGLRTVVIAAVKAANSSRRRALARMSRLTRLVLATAGLAAAVAVGLAVFGALRPGAWGTCFHPDLGDPVCPTGHTTTGADLLIIEAFGMVGATASALVTARALRDVTLPAPLAMLVAALKLPLGALLAAVVMRSIAGGAVPGLSALDTVPQIIGWSIFLGACQQILTAWVDRRLVRLGTRTSRWYESLLRTGDHDGPPSLSAATPHGPTPRHRYRLVCLAVTLLSTALVFTPMGLALQSVYPPVVGGCAALLVAWQGVKRSPRHRLLHHRLRVLALAVGRTAACASIVALVVLLVHYAITALGGTAQVATIVATAVAGLLSLFVGTEVQAEVGKSLLGGHAQPGPVLIPRLRSATVRGVVAAAVALVPALMIAVRDPAPPVAWIAALSLIGVGLLVAFRRSQDIEDIVEIRATGNALRRQLIEVLARDGWLVESDLEVPPGVDSLLERVDLVLRQQQQTFAVQIHTAGPDEPHTDWRAASELLVATNALERCLPLRPTDIEPVMVLVDSAADFSLRKLARNSSMHLLEVQGSAALSEQVRVKLAGLRGAAHVAPG